MSWTTQVNVYCERLGPQFWAEPVNAVTNLAFIVAAVLMAPHAQRARDPGAMLLCAILAVIGVGSFLFHTFATRWAGLADVLPILAFILVAVCLATRRFLGAPWWAAALATLAFMPVNWGTGQILRATVGSLNGSVMYAGVLVFLLAYAALLARRYPDTARGLLTVAGIFVVSVTARASDASVCGSFPLGTHFLWHIFNGLLLGWMIHVFLRHDRVHGRDAATAGRVARPAGSVYDDRDRRG